MISRRFHKVRLFLHHTSRLAMMTLACVLSGCVTETDTLNFTRSAQNQPDDLFEAAANRPPTAKTLYAMARLLATRGRDVESEWVLKRIISEHPEFMPAYCNLAELRMRQQRVDGAIQVLKVGLDVSPEDPVLWNNLGVCWIVKGDYEQALAMFTQAGSIIPYNARYRSNMAVALGMMGRYEESLSLFEQVVSAADAHYNLAVLCEARNDTTRAAEEYDEARELRQAVKSE